MIMLKSAGELFNSFLDFILPKRSDFEIVKKLDPETIQSVPRAKEVSGFYWIHPLFSYKDKRVRAIIWELKYRNNTYPLPTISKMLFDEILGVISDLSTFDSDAKFVLIPIPITNTKRSERGYNQSEYISRSIVENDIDHILLYAPQWLSKTKETLSQSHSQSKEERVNNLLDSFEANPQVENKYVILIDDVVTTGSTLSEARKELLSKGARDVLAFTIAH